MKIFFFFFWVNDQKYKILLTHPIVFNNLIKYLNFNKNLNIIQYNNKIFNQITIKNIPIKLNDKIEIITIVSGG
uniref:hypothetical protein n=1 Tax=Choristocarpus tenellus TaxID=116065 RepID=UPI002E75D0EE|nr:hypothetical protein V2478_pgp111 [Choristocarpus tenellus]WAM62304.1 hypothetical protein [Choristocarpus tenellus]